jgi:osmotically-inducible protein OsmY
MTRSAARTALLTAIAVVTLITPVAAFGAQPASVDLTSTFLATGLTVDRLAVYEVGGIVIIRGRTEDPQQAAKASAVAQQLGYTRVANLVQVSSAPDDLTLTRQAERELSRHRSLDGCKLSVDASHGVVNVAGTVHSELQKELAVELLKNLDGVRSVTVAWNR